MVRPTKTRNRVRSKGFTSATIKECSLDDLKTIKTLTGQALWFIVERLARSERQRVESEHMTGTSN